MFDKERFIEDCRAALKEKNTHAAIKELVEKAVSDPAALMRTIGEPAKGGVDTLYKAHDLTILNHCWGPQMVFKPHDHRMWAVIGIYTGREENSFFRRSADGLVRHGMKVMEPKDTTPLGASIIHAVTNPLDKVTGALHVYGGDFFAAPRSEWDPKTFREQPYDIEATMRAFEESNARLTSAR
jgi:predicted metal-dependent enzyme (double-stranded beta helix superfamily)